MIVTCVHIFYFTGISAYDNWVYCVNYSIIGSSNVKAECTSKLQTTLTSLQNDTFYTFTVSASGPGGERVTPDVFVFRTKSVGKLKCLTFIDKLNFTKLSSFSVEN